MSEAYERERQNNSRMDELASKVSSLRDVTINIYDSARDQRIIDDSGDLFQGFAISLKQSAGRITRMASSGTKTQTLRMAAIAIGLELEGQEYYQRVVCMLKNFSGKSTWKGW